MSEIKFSQVTDIDNPELRELAMNVVKTMQLAVEKATAHKADPSSYPIAADPDSFEQLFLSRFEQLRPEQQEAGIKNVMSSIKAPPADRIRLYGDLAKVDLRSAEAVETQAAKTFPDLLKAMQNEKNSSEPSTEQSLRSTSAASLEIRVRQVKCIKLTKGLGKDEIDLGGSTIDERGDIRKVPAFRVDEFKSGGEKSYNPPRIFATFDLLKTPSVKFPRSYFATFVLAEIDAGGGLSEFLDKLIDKIKDAVIAYLTPIAMSLGMTIGALFGSGVPILGTIIGAAIGAAVGFVIAKIVQLLKDWWKDDIFTPVTVEIVVPSSDASFQTPLSMALFEKFGGKYELWYDGNVIAPAPSEPQWAKMGDELVTGVGASSWRSGVIDLFVRGTDNLLYHKWYDKNSSGWKPNYDLVGPDRGFISGSPVAVSGGGSDLVDVFARGIGANDGVYQKVWQNSTWSNWQRLGTMDTLSSPGLSWEPTRCLNVYVRGTDNALYLHQYTPTGGWVGPWPLDRQISSSPTGIALKNGSVHVFARGMDNTLLHRRYDNGWQPWQSLGGPISGQISSDPESSPSVASWGAGHLDLYVRGTDDAVWHKSSKDSGTSWSNWERLGGSILSSPAAISREPNQVEVFVIGKDNKLYHIWQENSVWYPQ